jgi:PIN domain nuclease of toxin-antitoxin system
VGEVRLLLDTHALLWWAFDAPQLSRRARALLADPANELLVSAASAWEISTKHRLGRMPEVAVLVQDMTGWFARAGLTDLPMTVAHAQRAGALTANHGDPFDRMLAAQSLLEDVPILGRDKALLDFGVQLIW